MLDEQYAKLRPCCQALLKKMCLSLKKYPLVFSTYSDIKVSGTLVLTMIGFVITYGAILSQVNISSKISHNFIINISKLKNIFILCSANSFRNEKKKCYKLTQSGEYYRGPWVSPERAESSYICN